MKTFCQSFYGISSLEWVKIYFKSGLTVEVSKDAKLLMLSFDNKTGYRNHVRTELTSKIEIFLKENNLI